MSRQAISAPSAVQVERAIRLTYAQMMLNAVFGASTGGMFLIGFAIALGADDVLLGVMSTVPQLFVVFQFVAAWLVERGHSRKRLTVTFAFLTPLCWFLIAAIPFLAPMTSGMQRLGILIGVMTLVTVSGQFVGNARSSWIGELIPEGKRGRFFGNCTLWAGVVGAAFAVAEGKFLDYIRTHGLFAFAALFFFGAAFGLASAALNFPQPDCPLPGGGKRSSFRALVGGALRNRPFALLAAVHAVIALGNICGPFVAAYALRDVGMSFFGLGLVNAAATTSMLLTSPLWGRFVDRHGCRPALILGLLLLAPMGCVWLFIPPGSPGMAYALLPLSNLVAGVGSAALSVAISTLVYKLSNAEGRSVQFAAYSSFVTLAGAPMPLLGGWLVAHLKAAGHGVDLRLTFYLWSAFMFLAAGIATFLREPKSTGVRALVFSYFPNRVARFWGTLMSSSPLFASLIRFQVNGRRGGDEAGPPRD